MSYKTPNSGQDVHLSGCEIVCQKAAYVFSRACLKARCLFSVFDSRIRLTSEGYCCEHTIRNYKTKAATALNMSQELGLCGASLIGYCDRCLVVQAGSVLLPYCGCLAWCFVWLCLLFTSFGPSIL